MMNEKKKKNNKNCYVCKKEVICKCFNELNTNAKFLTCYITENFPKATLNNKMAGCHLCSKKCWLRLYYSNEKRQYCYWRKYWK